MLLACPHLCLQPADALGSPARPRPQAPLAAARRPLQTGGTALGQPAGEQAVAAQQQQQALAQQQAQAAVQQQQQQAQAQAVAQQQQQQAEPVDQLEGEQPQVQLATQQPAEQQQQQVAAAATQQQAATTAVQQPEQQSQGQQGVDEMFLCQDKLANTTIVEQLPQLKIEQVLNSNKPRSPQDVTLVTQLSFERWVPGGGAERGEEWGALAR